jgi:hypothetical protein
MFKKRCYWLVLKNDFVFMGHAGGPDWLVISQCFDGNRHAAGHVFDSSFVGIDNGGVEGVGFIRLVVFFLIPER